MKGGTIIIQGSLVHLCSKTASGAIICSMEVASTEHHDFVVIKLKVVGHMHPKRGWGGGGGGTCPLWY